MADHQHGKKYSSKIILYSFTQLASGFVGVLLAWIICQMVLGFNFYVNSQIKTNQELKESIEVTLKPSKLPSEAIESWKSWMKINGLFKKAAKKHLDHQVDPKSSPLIKILYWNDPNEGSSLAIGNWDGTFSHLERSGCPIFQCQLINRLSLPPSVGHPKLSDFDAILFRYNNLDVTDLPKERWNRQKYVFYEVDSPLNQPNGFNIAKMIPKEFFNLTMTYRWDSDIIVPIGGWLEPESSEMIDEHHTTDKSKSKMIALVVDDVKDCPKDSWKRSQNELIEQMMKAGIQVDIIRQSDCARLESINDCIESSPKYGDNISLECREKIAREYAFYFAIEEDLCLDYITEKFYSMLDHPIIPLVMDARGNYAKVAPPHSYINFLDFSSVQTLANYLINLNENHHLYNEYFEWKNYFKVRRNDQGKLAMNHLCNLCATLHEKPHSKGMNNHHNDSYQDISDWWIRKAGCTKVENFNMIEMALALPFL